MIIAVRIVDGRIFEIRQEKYGCGPVWATEVYGASAMRTYRAEEMSPLPEHQVEHWDAAIARAKADV